MKITPVKEIGSHRPLCEVKIRVCAGLKTRSAQHGAFLRKRAGIPVDQCGHRSDFKVDGVPHCSAHAGQAALNHMLGEKN